jgi:organic radical activating enzyme
MKYDELIEKLSKLPAMNSAVVYDGGEPLLRDGKAVEAQLIKFVADDRESAEKTMVHEVMSLIRGKHEIWIRVMPEIKSIVDEDTGATVIKGYARIAVA